MTGGLREALLSALNAHGEATLDNGTRVRVLPEAVLRDVLALHDSPVIASRERVAEVLAVHVIECTGIGEVTCRGCRELSWMSMGEYLTHVADALLSAGVFRDDATVKAEARQQAARSIRDEAVDEAVEGRLALTAVIRMCEETGR